MTYYRAYVIGPDGHFETAHILECDDDAAAIQAASNTSTAMMRCGSKIAASPG
jgi:hypothetical protein